MLKEIGEQSALKGGMAEKAREFVEKGAEVYAKASGVKLTTMKATFSEPEIVTRKGKPVSVILPIKDYKELLERAEDAEDVAWLKRVRSKKLHYRPLEEYLTNRNGK